MHRFKLFIAEYERRGDIERKGLVHPHSNEADDETDSLDNPDEIAKLKLLKGLVPGEINHDKKEKAD